VVKVSGSSANTGGITGNDMLTMSSLSVSSGSFNVILQPVSMSSPQFTASNATPTNDSTAPVAGSYIVLAQNSAGAGSLAGVVSMLQLINNGVAPSSPSDAGIILDTWSPSGGGDDLIAEDCAAPEPTSFLLVGLAVSPLLLSRRRRTAI
jgi:hypothetical protein